MGGSPSTLHSHSVKFCEWLTHFKFSVQINDISTGLLAILLIPTLLKTAKEHITCPRIVVVGSETHHWVSLKPSLLNQPSPLRTLSESEEYCTAKWVDFQVFCMSRYSCIIHTERSTSGIWSASSSASSSFALWQNGCRSRLSSSIQ